MLVETAPISANLVEVAALIRERAVTPRPDCMIWPGGTSEGYGRIHANGKSLRVHRVVWEAEHGPIPDDLTIDHLCRVRTCCNTKHMELVTQEENTARAVRYRLSRGKWALQTHCKSGHEFTPENTRIRPTTGHRDCRECGRLRKIEQRRAASALKAAS